MGNIEVRVDVRLELIQTVMYLTGCKEKTHQTTLVTSYTGALERYFNQHREHRAVKIAAELLSQGYTYRKPVRLAFYLGNPPELDEVESVEQYLSDDEFGLIQTAEVIREYLRELRNFAVHSCFESFWTGQEDYLSHVKQKVVNAVKATVVEELEGYYGQKLGGYHLVASPLAGNYGFSAPLTPLSGAYCVIMVPREGLDGSLWPSRESVTNTCKHEFSHCIINPLTKGHLSEVQSLKGLKNLHKNGLQAYSWWPTTINESIIRACQARFFHLYPKDGLRELGPEWTRDPKEAWLSFCEKQMGLPLTRGLETLLVEYEANRRHYRSISEFYPVILGWLQQENRVACGA